MQIITMIMLFASFFSVGDTEVPIPMPDPDCITPWYLLWEFDDCKYCNGGHFYQFQCMTENEYWSNYHQKWINGLKYTSICIEPVLEEQQFISVIPLISKNYLQPTIGDPWP